MVIFMGPRHKLHVYIVEVWPFVDRMAQWSLDKQTRVPTLVFRNQFTRQNSYRTHAWRHAFILWFCLYWLLGQVCEWCSNNRSPWWITIVKLRPISTFNANAFPLSLLWNNNPLYYLHTDFYFEVTNNRHTEIALCILCDTWIIFCYTKTCM